VKSWRSQWRAQSAAHRRMWPPSNSPLHRTRTGAMLHRERYTFLASPVRAGELETLGAVISRKSRCSLPVRFAFHVAMLLVGIRCSPCANEIEQSVVSASGEFKALAFQRDCGATTGFSTHVSVLRASRTLPNDDGNAFICTPTRTASRSVVLSWSAPHRLKISYSKGVQVFRKASNVGEVTIEYAEVPPRE
jgi:hypothetical protein